MAAPLDLPGGVSDACSCARFFAPLEASLKQMVADFGTPPKAILMISGHWEEDNIASMGAGHPPMMYDYLCLPPETYQIQYNAPCAPEIEARTQDLLGKAESRPISIRRGGMITGSLR